MTDTERMPLSNPPLVYALCQVRFSTVLAIESSLPAIQDKLRGEFPRFNKEVLHLLRISHLGGPVEPTMGHRWTFVNKSNDAGFALTPDSFVYHTTAYLDFVEFSSALQRGLEVVDDVLNISLVERVGLRYIDYIEPAGEKSLVSYVHHGLCGFTIPGDDLEVLGQRHEARFKSRLGQLVLKYTQGSHKSLLPEDLLPLSLSLSKQGNPTKETGVLDFDHFRQSSEDFDVSRIMSVLKGLHAGTRRSFRMAVSKEALQEWT